MSNPENTPAKGAFDPARFKEQERAGFNLVADRYEEAMGMMSVMTARLLDLAALEPGMRVLDVATGPGIMARIAAREVGAEGRVIGVDIAEEALALASRRAAEEGLSQLTFQVEDAENLNSPDASFDRVLCSLGLMHFPAPQKALSEMERVLKPGGRFVGAVWGEASQAPFIQAALATLSRNFPPPKIERPSMFRFGQPAALEKLIAEAGFTEVKTEPVMVEVRVKDGPDYWKRFLGVAGITTVALAKQPPEMMQRLEHDVESDLAPYRRDTDYLLPNTLLLVTGIKA